MNIIKALAENNMVCSMAEARRAVSRGAVKVNAQRVTDINADIASGDMLQIGKQPERIFNDQNLSSLQAKNDCR